MHGHQEKSHKAIIALLHPDLCSLIVMLHLTCTLCRAEIKQEPGSRAGELHLADGGQVHGHQKGVLEQCLVMLVVFLSVTLSYAL